MVASDQSSPRVLVVDDEVIIADTQKLILRNAGYQCRIAYDGATALKLASEWKPNILLCDVYMPGLNGIEIAMQCRTILPQCRILLISGRADVEDMLRDFRARGLHFDLLVKPLHPDELLKILRKP